nr:ABC transporter ATP-binding protein [Maliibacterium massiliense]
MPQTNIILNFEDVGMDYYTLHDETPALENITFSVHEGEFIAIIGPSGCGKSTILSLAAGLLKPTRGTITLLGDTVCGPRPDVGYMLQSDYLFPWRTVRNNILLGLDIQHKRTAEAEQHVNHLIKMYGLEGFADYYPKQLSGGMRQRAALIRTLATQPRLLLLDESFSALDSQTRLAVSDDIARIIREEKKTAVLVTHDISEAVAMADRVVVLSRRPSVVKGDYNIRLSSGGTSPIARRKAPEFKEYFDTIWKELDVHVA